MPRRTVLLICLLFLSFLALVLILVNSKKDSNENTTSSLTSILKVAPDPYPYKIPPIPKKRSYLTLLAGDSMLASLGVNANPLRLKLISYYPDNEFVNYNYGFPSTNIETLPERLQSETLDRGTKYQAILNMNIDLIKPYEDYSGNRATKISG